jgi:Mg2+ and Co2+ transporter CorA
MAYQTLTFEELAQKAIDEINEKRFPDSKNLYPELDGIEESLTMMEQCLEMYDASTELVMYEAQYECAKALAFEGERWESFKGTVKKIWLKIIEYIKKAIKVVIQVITWPFKMIYQLLTRKKNRMANIAIGLRDEKVTIETPLKDMIKSIDTIKKEQEKLGSESILDMEYIQNCQQYMED